METLRSGSKIEKHDRILLLGAAGLVGQNLALLLREQGFSNLVGIDKHHANIGILRRLNPGMQVIEADLAEPGEWEGEVAKARVVVMLQAQIGGEQAEAFEANNIRSTQRVLAALQHNPEAFLVHISSSVVNSMAVDFYTETKKAQELLVRESHHRYCVLRPTLMFGWFDRKHLGWLSRFMQRVPVFPIPGSGRYLRQPLFVLDFCRIILRCMEVQPEGEVYDITGRERIFYIELIRRIRDITCARARVVRIPYLAFAAMLRAYALVSSNPPFTTKQLRALVTPDEFELIRWWEIFEFSATPLDEALSITFRDPRYSAIALDF
jgi:nucleoside-diphosphate-sugar epimerase